MTRADLFWLRICAAGSILAAPFLDGATATVAILFALGAIVYAWRVAA